MQVAMPGMTPSSDIPLVDLFSAASAGYPIEPCVIYSKERYEFKFKRAGKSEL
jgi:hypothetical protein